MCSFIHLKSNALWAALWPGTVLARSWGYKALREPAPPARQQLAFRGNGWERNRRCTRPRNMELGFSGTFYSQWKYRMNTQKPYYGDHISQNVQGATANGGKVGWGIRFQRKSPRWTHKPVFERGQQAPASAGRAAVTWAAEDQRPARQGQGTAALASGSCLPQGACSLSTAATAWNRLPPLNDRSFWTRNWIYMN